MIFAIAQQFIRHTMLPFVVRNWRTILPFIAVAAFLAAGAYLHHRIDQGGYERCKLEQSVATLVTSNKIFTNIEKVRNESEKMDDSAIDNGLANLGIMRRPSDR